MKLHIHILAALITTCLAKIWEIQIPRSLQDCYNHVQHASVENFVGSTFSWLCEAGLKREKLGQPVKFDAQKSSYYDQLYTKAVPQLQEQVRASNSKRNSRGRGRGKRQVQVLPRCVRKEYRMLTDAERIRFHNAINALKSDTSVEPNKYDAIALLHTGMASFTAHGGPGFPGWHRIYTLMFETALREVDPAVCLPYWDSSLDNELDDPRESHVWSADFFGTSQGPVVEGPFAGWRTPDGAQLMRNVGTDGDLFAAAAIEDVLSRTRHGDIITAENVEPRFDLEFHHAAVHVYCGGTMGQLDTAAFDPIFFMTHSFVDYLWELFRTNLRSLGVDPEIYPDVEDADSRHHGSALTGFGDLTQADSYLDSLTESYEFESAPICTARFPECGSLYLTCLPRIGRCVPISIAIGEPVPVPGGGLPVPPAPGGGLPVPPAPLPVPVPSPSTNCPVGRKHDSGIGLPVQNDYCCDHTCDSNQWAMIPVKIVSVRPPKFSNYQSFPVRNGVVDHSFDIYSPEAYSQTNQFISSKTSNPMTFSRCAGDEISGQVFVSSQGLNYDGYYKEAAIVDHRLAVSMSMGFVAIKRPARGSAGVSHALLRAHDSCGRVCHAACKNEFTGEYELCSGAVALSDDLPLMYGSNYDEAVMSVFNYKFNNDCPSFKQDNFFITFYCDYHNEFPYADHNHGPVPSPAQKPRVPVPQVPIQLPNVRNGCRVTSQCVLDVPCASSFRQCSFNNEIHRCRGSCRAYGRCQYGRYFLRLCPDGSYFDDELERCVEGFCQKVVGQERILSNRGRGSFPRSSGRSYQDQLLSRINGRSRSSIPSHSHSHRDTQSLPALPHTRETQTRKLEQVPAASKKKPTATKPRVATARRPQLSDMISSFMKKLTG